LTAPLWLGLLVSSCIGPSSELPAAAVANRAPAASSLPAAPARVPSIGELAGMAPPEILALLGKPDLQRDEPPAEIWQYRTADCVLDLFFYQQGDELRLVHAETRDRELAVGVTPQRCRDDGAPLRAHLRQSRL
jgi:hypothetical protein